MENKLVFTDVEEVREYNVKAQGNSGHLYLPKDWIGRRVKVVLLKDEDDH